MKEWIFILLIAIPLVSSIQISEFELNPAGTDTGNEWIEFYCGEKTDLKNYEIINNDGNKINLSGNCEGYFIYVFEKQWLDNTDEKIILRENGKLIDETKIADDSKNDDSTWQFCDEWVFKKETKNQKNCDEKIEEEIIQKNGTKSKSVIVEKLAENKINSSLIAEEKNIETIKLTGKNIKGENVNEILKKNNYAIYGFVIFCILIVFLFILKFKKGKYKNEFE